MDLVVQGLAKAFRLLVSGDPEVLQITFLTLRVSGLATLISLGLGVPLGLYLAVARFRGRELLVGAVNTGMGLPPTVVGLWVSILLWRNGPLGMLNLMYTPTAIVIAQAVIAAPVVTGLTMAAVQQLNPKLRLQVLALGASPLQFWWLIIREVRFGILAAVMAGLGSVISEVGASMAVGGNVRWYTRVLTTAIVLEVSKGNFDMALALGFVLMLLAYSITYVLTIVQQRRRRL
ncbi:MAG TPA: ABC transporter permease [Firmicutes bacterium]|jgi:tungstate transport system permease protein|uniref:ABC transporter permease n=1 Tax=Gelria sp. Kuro-4 TaxID=2796927 RepID=UPI00199E2DC9|nr:ABC transporter permease [Gelria sp. Kuro-4]MDI3521980.1 tungstate transport system permease protein [Bacillota bacterium]MDK2927439.1 tungstate transport system permease protein [Bacillota bacterium]BCV23547.1 ABC transporter permease [Gelria sp. Kuro-4]HHV57137.1 ABC transporter permease [Bacillota bacterium]